MAEEYLCSNDAILSLVVIIFVRVRIVMPKSLSRRGIYTFGWGVFLKSAKG